MLHLQILGLLAIYAVATVSAGIVNRAAVPARATDHADLLEKSANGVSPVPTAEPKPELVAMELFKRTLGSDTCGWYGDYKSESKTCNQVGASCINIGSYRGCCNGPTLSCISTFYTACISSTDLTVSGTARSCGEREICCSSTRYPECGTFLYSANDHKQNTFTILNCFAPNAGSTYGLQDDPAGVTTSTSTSSSSSSTSTTTSTPIPAPIPSPLPDPTPTPTPTPTPPPDDDGTPIEAIVGGVVGGVGGIGLVVLAVVFLMRRRSRNSTNPSPPVGTIQSPPPAPQPQPQMAQAQYHPPSNTGVPPAYGPRYSYAVPLPSSFNMGGAESNTGVFSTASPSLPSPHSPDPMKMAGGPGADGGATGPHVTAYEVGALNEAPSTNPVGTGNNQAELL